MRIKDHLIDLASLFLVLAGIFMRVTGKVVIIMFALALIGFLYWFVAGFLGLPYEDLYDVFDALVKGIRAHPFCGFQ